MEARQQQTFYDAVGGRDVFVRLVSAFYAGVADDPVLRPLYPDADLAAAEERLLLFLMQYWGGPTTYSDTRGHPRLRMRHAGWQITTRERDAWLSHMMAAVGKLDIPAGERAQLVEYLENAAHALVNAPDQRPAG